MEIRSNVEFLVRYFSVHSGGFGGFYPQRSAFKSLVGAQNKKKELEEKFGDKVYIELSYDGYSIPTML